MRKLLLHLIKFKKQYEQSGRVYRVYEIPFDGCNPMDIDNIPKIMKDAENGLREYFQKNHYYKYPSSSFHINIVMYYTVHCTDLHIHATDLWTTGAPGGSITFHISSLP